MSKEITGQLWLCGTESDHSTLRLIMQLAEHRPFLKIGVQRSGRMYLRIAYLFRVNIVMLSVVF